jgi:hypothetical protein
LEAMFGGESANVGEKLVLRDAYQRIADSISC